MKDGRLVVLLKGANGFVGRNIAPVSLGKKSRIMPFPLFALNALFRISRRSEASDSVARSLEVDTSKAMMTGWRPPFSLDEGLRSAPRTTRSS